MPRFSDVKLNCGPLRFRVVAALLATIVIPAVCGPTLTLAAETPEPSAAAPASESAAKVVTGGLVLIDWIIIAAYAIGTIALGYWFSRKQRDTSEYFVGSGRMNPLLIGVSLFATLLSTISYLSMPGEVAGKGPVGMLLILWLPLIYFIASVWLLPTYMRQRVTSAYELLEEKLGLGIRLLGAGMFLTLRLVWMSLLVYLAAKAMTVMLGVGEDWIPTIVLVTGLVSVIYTSLGGLQAVVITDFVQTVLLFGGAWLVIGVVTFDFGGFGWIPTEWHDSWDKQPFFSFDPSTRVTVVGSLLTSTVWFVATIGGDQTSVQRFMATEDAAAARWALRAQLMCSALVAITLTLVGFALLAWFADHPSALPAGATARAEADHLFPRFIAFHLPPGISGLVVAAMFAAAMSSIDSGVNSITAVVMTDFLDRFGLRPETEKGHVRAAQLLALVIGGTVVIGSSFIGAIPGNITEVTQKSVNLLVGPIFALFVFALFIPIARAPGVVAGTVAGITTAVLIAFSGPLFGVNPVTGYDPVSFQWIGPASLAVNLLVGCGVSLEWSALFGPARNASVADSEEAGSLTIGDTPADA